MAEPAPRVPRRGERGFKAAAAAGGGDPRLRPVPDPEPAPEPAEPSPPPAGPRRRRSARQTAASAAGRVGSVGVPQRVPVVGGATVDDGAGLVLGMLAWVITVQYLRGGMPGVKAWLRAKFLNQTSGAGAGSKRVGEVKKR